MIIKLNNKICKDKNEAIDLIKEGKDFNLSITLDNGDEYEIKYYDASVSWHKNGQLHREEGPATIHYDGVSFWYKDGMLHRENGPACEYPNGIKYWFKNGIMQK